MCVVRQLYEESVSHLCVTTKVSFREVVCRMQMNETREMSEAVWEGRVLLIMVSLVLILWRYE